MTSAAALPARLSVQRARTLAEAPSVVPDLIATLTGTAGGGLLRREEALDQLRRHLGRIQARVQEAFESQELTGLAAVPASAEVVIGGDVGKLADSPIVAATIASGTMTASSTVSPRVFATSVWPEMTAPGAWPA